ncbi:MAG: integrase family protein [Polaromonas sp.]|nr:integrase family protein [Polaromonas sp.]
MRRTKVTWIYRRTNNLRAVQLLLGHSKLESTVRYLGIEVDDGAIAGHALVLNGGFLARPRIPSVSQEERACSVQTYRWKSPAASG